MIYFNDSGIVTGFIKQKLASFNLPKCKVYTRAHRAYFLRTGKESPEIIETVIDNGTSDKDRIRYVPYIKDDILQEYINGKWENKGRFNNSKQIQPNHLHHYEYGMKLLNYTKTLKISSNIYDSYTHEYLGDYLRFHRDYLNLDLMPLYNCFSDNLCEALSITSINPSFTFDTSDSRYKIYMLPVKLFKSYTIAIDSDLPVEICCGMYGKYLDTRSKFINLPKATYRKFSQLNYTNPILFDSLANISGEWVSPEVTTEIVQNENDLKMFIKLPVDNNSSITILEGDYRDYAPIQWPEIKRAGDGVNREFLSEPVKIYSNKSIINMEYINELDDDSEITLITNLQLLQGNTGRHMPFADRLLEYLVGNAITNIDENTDNIKRVETVLENLKFTKADESLDNITFANNGLWDDKIKYIIYDYLYNSSNIATEQGFTDILGYIDKDVENTYRLVLPNKGTVSLKNIDIYPNIYKDSKK